MKKSPFPPRRPQAGFSLVELSMVLIVIALLAGAASVGGDLQRNAAYQKIGSAFIRGWQLAYLSYAQKTNVVVLDSQTTPTGFVNQNGAEVCGDTLRAAMLGAGVEMPQGRAEGRETHYSYLDSNGNPQDVEVCFQSITWMVPSATDGIYVEQTRNVMVIKNLTPDLARLVDSLVDTVPDAQFGKVREYPSAATLTSPPSREYSLNNTCVYGVVCAPGGSAYDEAQVATLSSYYLMDR